MVALVRDIGRLLVVLGLVIAGVGLVLMVAPRLPWLGQLPGDVHVERDGVSFHFPVVTCLVVSIVLTLILSIILRR